MLEQITISDAVAQFLKERQSRNKSFQTLKLYTQELRYFCEWLERNGYGPTFDDLNPTILREWFSALATHRNPGGIHCNFRICKTFFNWVSFEYDLTDWKNPIRKVYVAPNKTLPLPEIPIPSIQALLTACDSGYNCLRDKAILKTLLDTGCRGSELIGLNYADIDLKTGSVAIHHGKGNKPRICYLGSSSTKALRDYLKTREDLQPQSPLFLNDQKERLQFFGLRMLIVRLCKRANIKTYGVHCFRRTFALTVYRKTRDIFLVSKLLGHSKVETTIRYLNIGNEDLRDGFISASPADLLN